VSIKRPQPDRDTLIKNLCAGKVSVESSYDAQGIFGIYSNPSKFRFYSELDEGADIVKLIHIFTTKHSYIQGPFDKFYTHTPINICEYKVTDGSTQKRYRGLQWTNGLVVVMRESINEYDEVIERVAWRDVKTLLGCYVRNDTAEAYNYP